jgi:uncharacterized protein (TIGR00725 family)
MSPTLISVFGSSRSQERSEQYRMAYELGCALGEAGFSVATGGYSGVMEAVSRGASERGAHVVGVAASSLPGRTNPWVKEIIVVASWQERLHKLIDLGEGYVVCGGGTGTLAELAVAWEMMSKRVMPRRPLVALGDFWQPIVERITLSEEGAGSEGFVHFASSIAAALEILGATGKAAR